MTPSSRHCEEGVTQHTALVKTLPRAICGNAQETENMGHTKKRDYKLKKKEWENNLASENWKSSA